MSLENTNIFPQKINNLFQPLSITQSKILSFTKSAFNSKLFIDLHTIDENDYNNESFSNSTKTDYSQNFDDDYYLSNDLISELDIQTPPLNEQNSNNNNILDNLMPLISNGYEFIPKNFNLNKENKIVNKKVDWICSFCRNLNYSFRTKCNRCKVSREDSENQEKINRAYNEYR